MAGPWFIHGSMCISGVWHGPGGSRPARLVILNGIPGPGPPIASSSIIKLARVKPERHSSRSSSCTSPLTSKPRPESNYGRIGKGLVLVFELLGLQVELVPRP